MVENLTDNIIRVDRTVCPAYPKSLGKVWHKELENTGPAEYDIAQVELWYHENQKIQWLTDGFEIYKYLQDPDKIQTCLGLSDLIAIQGKGHDFFQRHFSPATIPDAVRRRGLFAWKSFAQSSWGNCVVPSLFEYQTEVRLSWTWVYPLCPDEPALRFRQ